MKINYRRKVALAALLHDIGKFWERADERYDLSEVIKNEFPNGEYSHTVPTYDTGYPKYGHALWTQAFLNKKYNGKTIGQIFDLDVEGELTLTNLSARHHQPSNPLERVISLADSWSSAIDRPDAGEEGVEGYSEIKDKWGEGFNKKIPLQSIFDQIQVNSNKNDTINSFKIQKLDVLNSEAIFSSRLIADKNANLTTEYKKLWELFLEEYNALVDRCKGNFDAFYLSLCDLLRNYTWCIPSATNVDPANVSLYEHLKTTAGLATCIYDYYADRLEDVPSQNTNKEEDNLMMLCIDISGIQKFIYDIANKKAAKSLKGRSFFLQLFMQNIIDRIIDHKEIQAYHSNVIYASGGKAYLILPNIEKVEKALKDIEFEIQEYVRIEHHGKIYAVFGFVKFGYKTLFDSKSKAFQNYVYTNDLSEKEKTALGIAKEKIDLGDLWRIVSDRAASKKNRKFETKVLDFSIFEPEDIDFSLEKCQVTGIRSKNLKDLNDDDRDPENKVMVLSSVYDQAKLGGKLKEGNFLISLLNSSSKGDIKIGNYSFEISDKGKLQKVTGSNERANVYIFNNSNLIGKLDNVGIRSYFYGGNIQPQNANGEAKTFEDLATTYDGNTTKLAILRMDVDNLGQIFIKGFDNKVQKKSFAAYATLSFMLEAFFCGYINQIHQKNKLFKEYVQILYSGGDDLFAVGRWDAIIDFAAEVRSKFRDFVKRDDITISGGIAIVGAKYPIMKSAELSGEAEKKAKSHNGNTKNAINFFGETVSWDEEFEDVKRIKDSFLYFEKQISKALIQNVQKFKLQKDTGKEKNDISYIWQSAYSMKRYIDRIDKDNIEAKSFVESVSKKMLHNSEFGSERYLDLVALGARWAEYIIKQKNL